MGRGKIPEIGSSGNLVEKVRMLDSMQDLENASNIMQSVEDAKRNRMDVWYDNLGATITPLNPLSDKFKTIEVLCFHLYLVI